MRKPATAGRIVGHALGAGVGAVGAAEGVIDVDVAQPGQFLRPCRVVLGLALVEAGVLQHQHLAGLERRGGRFGLGAGGHADELAPAR